MLVGYVRVSKSDGSQTLDLQKDAMKLAGVEDEAIYEDLMSGRKDDRPGLCACLKALRKGDTLVIWKLDRLGRDLKHLINTVDTLSEREVGFKVLAGCPIDTTTPSGKLVFTIFAGLAEFERETIVERTKAGLESARARGRMGGRPRKMDKATLKLAMAAMANKDMSPSEVCSKLHLSPTTLYTYINGDGSLKAEGQAILETEEK